jgi:SAM-dependent methyltransferase
MGVIAESPDATRAPATCAWCEQPLAIGPLPPLGRLRCTTCGASTPAGWASEHPPARGARLQAQRGAHRLCSLGEAARRSAGRRLALRIARVAPPGAVLDVGSGDGLLLDALRATGRLVTGIERPPTRAGIHDAEITELGGRYAAIVFWQSLGRLRTPGAALEHAAALLKPGGLLAIAEPNAARQQARALGERWLAREVPRAPVQIPAQTLLERLHALGLQIERVDRRFEGRPAGGWLPGVLGGIVSIEARR